VATKTELINLEVTGKPFTEAVAFLRDKAQAPTAAWHEMIGQYHAKAFTVAGAVKDTLLADFYEGITAAIAKGETLEQFRKRFDDTVARHGWAYNGARGWRSRLIYNTNIQTAYQAGRYKQLQEMTDVAPYWEYSARNDGRTRPQHKQWDGITLPANDPWWDTHYPPNGWNCRCRVWPRTKGDLRRAGKSGPDQAPPLEMEERTIKANGEKVTVRVPKGIDTGWDYNVGKSAFGTRPAIKGDIWEDLTKGNWESLGRPRNVPVDTVTAKKGKVAATTAEVEDMIRQTIGGDQRVYTVTTQAGFTHETVIDAGQLAGHIIKDILRTKYIPFLHETLEDPYEVWMAFAKNKKTGQVSLRMRYVKVVDAGEGMPILAIMTARKGMFESLTMMPSSDKSYVNRQRKGVLLYGRD